MLDDVKLYRKQGAIAVKKTLLVTAVMAAAAMAVATGASAATLVYDFSSATGNLGTTETYTQGGLSIVAAGYSSFNHTTDLYGKHNGGDENGLGMANDPTGDHEIHFLSGFVQLDLNALLGKVLAGSTFFTTNSSTGGEQWAVYGSNTAGSYGGGALLTGTSEGSHALPSVGSYRYYDFVEVNHTHGTDDNFLIGTLTTTTAVPEPTSWAMMIVGFFGLGATLRRARRSTSAATA
jgi:hypothetical protein